MRTKSYVLGVMGSAMIATSAAAVDVPPVGGAEMAMPSVEANGPELTVDIAKILWTGGGGFGPFGFGTQLAGDVDVKWASGWGAAIRFYGGSRILPGPLDFGGGLEYRVYRSIGDFEVGVGGEAGGGCFFGPLSCSGGFAFNANLVYDYESDRLSVRSENYLWFFPGFEFDSFTELEFHITDQLLLEADLWVESCAPLCWDLHPRVTYDLTDVLSVWGEIGLASGGLHGVEFGAEYQATERLELWADVRFNGFRLQLGANYEVLEWLDVLAEFGWSPGGWDVELGAEIEDQIGTGPYSLIGGVYVGYGTPCCGFGFSAMGGIRYTLGDVDRDWQDLID